jgi:Cu2+-exporting ATPase
MGSLTLAKLAPDIADDLSQFVHPGKDGSNAFEVAVAGARCANCIAKIESGVMAIDGVTYARLNLSTGKLAVEWNGDAVSPHFVIQRVRALGYVAQPYDAATTLDESAKEGLFLVRCLAVASFGTVFVMGLTDAIWYGGNDMGAGLRTAFFSLAAAVSVPATLYSAQPFFRSAWASLASRGTNMDVPISLAIILSLGLSLYQTAIGGTQVYFDAAIMLTFLLLIGRYLDFLLRDRARGAAQHLVALQSSLARRLRDDMNVEAVAAKELIPGDRIVLASGERAPVDVTLDDGGTDADISLVTGESAPVSIARGGVLRAGSIIVGRPVILRATARADNSLVADLARLLEAGQQNRSVYVRLADRAARAYVPFVTGLALMIFGGWVIAGAPFAVALTNAITVLVITCPCALGLAVPAVQIVATGRLFNRGMFVKSGDALERLAEIDMAVFDKTGTLTVGMPELLNAREIPPDVLKSAARIARASRHPLAHAVALAAGVGPVAPGVREIPGCGLEATTDGVTQKLGSAAWCGVREIAHASELWFASDDSIPVRFAFSDTIRPDAAEMLAALKRRGIAVEMLTGDREAPAAAMAAEAGISDWRASIDPREKADRMEELRRQGRHVLMVGDGLNDTGALALAHVSIAPGTAADASQLASDMVLRGASLMPIVEAIDVARKARRLVLENFALALAYNLTAIPLAALGLVSPLIAAATMAGSSLIVTLNALRLAAGKRA